MNWLGDYLSELRPAKFLSGLDADLMFVIRYVGSTLRIGHAFLVLRCLVEFLGAIFVSIFFFYVAADTAGNFMGPSKPVYFLPVLLIIGAILGVIGGSAAVSETLRVRAKKADESGRKRK